MEIPATSRVGNVLPFQSEGEYRSCGSMHTMRTTIDKAGRLVIPRALRDRIGLAGGGEVELELDGAAVRIEPISGSDLLEEAGLLVIPASGGPITNAAVRELIDADRHGR
jgi:AbrB family looped-hinge helix DNA binding protein